MMFMCEKIHETLVQISYLFMHCIVKLACILVLFPKISAVFMSLSTSLPSKDRQSESCQTITCQVNLTMKYMKRYHHLKSHYE